MRALSAAELAGCLDDGSLIARIDQFFRDGATVPVRHHHAVPVPGEAGATLLLMPAWREGAVLGVKIATVFPGNASRALPSVMASYLLFDGRSGAPLAMMDGRELTARRTAAASALASRYLSRPQSRRLLVVGTGTLAPHLVRAHRAVRPIAEVAIWGRRPERARAIAAELAAGLATAGARVAAADDLMGAVAAADIVSCATLAATPLIMGDWLRPGQHLDLVGGFTPAMREADDAAIRRARVFCDTREGALKEAGDLVQPLRAGVIAETDVIADLAELARGVATGRRAEDEITLFKSVGTALEDLAAATLAWERASAL